LLGQQKGKGNRKKQTNHLVIGNGPCAPRISRRYLFCFQPSVWSVCGQLSYGPIIAIIVVHDLIFFCHHKAPVFPAFVGAISNSNNSLTFLPFLCRAWSPEPLPGRASDVEHAELGEGGRRRRPAEATEAAVLEAAVLARPFAPRRRAVSSGDRITNGTDTRNAITLAVRFAM
jgi:hypothetical protein